MAAIIMKLTRTKFTISGVECPWQSAALKVVATSHSLDDVGQLHDSSPITLCFPAAGRLPSLFVCLPGCATRDRELEHS
jgi:hypothetical protein